MTSLLSPALMARLESLQIASRHRLLGRFGGEHKSKRYGNTVDFADFREYHPGDDFRRIDYHVMARLDQVLIKLFEADDEITVRLLIDTSGSMAVGGKMLQAKRLAAALGFVALTAHDSVSVHTFPSRAPAPRFAGRAEVPGFLDYVESLEAEGLTPFAEAARHLLSQSGLPGLTVVLSDLLTPEWSSLVQLRSSGSDVNIFHIMCEEDLEPDFTGDLELVDRELGDRLTVSVTDDVAASYRERVRAWRQDVATAARAAGAGFQAVNAEDDTEALLLTTWRSAGVLR
ncbi:MAG TPA: DUF58 domain-containing protein [Acidimicrobiia bacterium]|nr:DUF58 domain-containing protein [Acidimicrobiia bacterium]